MRQRRRAPGKRLAAAAVGQRERGREVEAPRVLRAAEAAPVAARAVVGTPLAVAVAALVEDTLRLLRTLVAAPFRIAVALRHLALA